MDLSLIPASPRLTDPRPRVSPASLSFEERHPRLTPASPGFTPLQAPPWGHRILPRWLRTAMADFGLWEPPTPVKPSLHLTQTSLCIAYYGWCQVRDSDFRGRLCIRGAQGLLEKGGYVSPGDRSRAENYMNSLVAEDGMRVDFFTWNDRKSRTEEEVHALLAHASAVAAKNGD